MTVRILLGDVAARLKELPDGIARTCVTSPPYWNLRDYKVDGQIGLEASPEEWCEKLVLVFREVRRVLADDGTLWLNLGDAYANHAKKSHNEKDDFTNGRGNGHGLTSWTTRGGDIPSKITGDIKAKDLLGLPWLLAFALRADGWYLRSEIIWQKPNPMPESVTDRPTTAHERIFVLTKSSRYFWDREAAREPLQPSSVKRIAQETLAQQKGSLRANDGTRRDGRPMFAVVRGSNGSKRPHEGKRPADTGVGFGHGYDDDPKPRSTYGSGNKRRKDRSEHGGTGDRGTNQAFGVPWESDGTGRNIRTVWTIPTQAYRGAHFATFPEAIPRRCIAIATSAQGKCSACGAAWGRVVERGARAPEPAHREPEKRLEPGQAGNVGAGNMGFRASKLSGQELNAWKKAHPDRLVGWRASCDCNAPAVPEIVLDPFGGAGTTALVAEQLGRDSILCELNTDYATLAAHRISAAAPLLTQVSIEL